MDSVASRENASTSPRLPASDRFSAPMIAFCDWSRRLSARCARSLAFCSVMSRQAAESSVRPPVRDVPEGEDDRSHACVPAAVERLERKRRSRGRLREDLAELLRAVFRLG